MKRLTVALCAFMAVASASGEGHAQAIGNGGRAGHERMVELLAQLNEERPFGAAYEAAVERLRQRVAALPNNASITQQLAMVERLAVAEIRASKPAAAFDHLDEVLNTVRFLPASQQLRLIMNARLLLGVLHLRLGLLGNCQGPTAGTKCALALLPDSVHRSQESTRDAIESLTSVLNLTQPEAPEHLAAQWLFTAATMTLGLYPDAIPPRHRIDPMLFPREIAGFPRFDDIGGKLGIDTFSAAGGLVVDDFDGDGWLDLVVSSADLGRSLKFFKNAAGELQDRSRAAGLGGITGGLNIVHADYDDDGDLDLLVLRGGWLEAAGTLPNSLLRNDGEGTFTDVTFEAGLGERHYASQTAAWADYDRDGDLDLFIGNEGRGRNAPPSQLFRNEGDGTFAEVGGQAGVDNRAWAKGASWGDYDEDGWPDLYVSNFGASNRLYRNRRDGTFEDVAADLGVLGPSNSYTAWFWDANNDGVLDILVNAYRTPQTTVPDIWYYAADLLGREHPAERLRLYLGDGVGGFADAADRFGVARVNLATGGNFGDLDNDGWLDFYLGTGYPGFEAVVPNLMYRNREGSAFVDVTYAGGFGHLARGQAVAFADYDNDGDEDVFIRMGGLIPQDEFIDSVYRNPGFENHWLAVELRGERSNHYGVGARVTAEFRVDGQRRSVHRVVGGSGGFGGNPMRLHLGIGASTRVDRLRIVWPGSGETQTFERIDVDQRILLTEGEAEFRVLQQGAAPSVVAAR